MQLYIFIGDDDIVFTGILFYIKLIVFCQFSTND